VGKVPQNTTINERLALDQSFVYRLLNPCPLKVGLKRTTGNEALSKDRTLNPKKQKVSSRSSDGGRWPKGKEWETAQ
jgi:hypothetical protein